MHKFGRIDVLINNAGFPRTHQALEEFTAEKIRYTFAVDIQSRLYLSKAAAKQVCPGHRAGVWHRHLHV